jgi:flagellar hook-associated protein 3 FlgL
MTLQKLLACLRRLQMINITDQMMFNLGNLNKENMRINYQLSSGKILQNGSDDTAVFSKDLYFNDKIRVYEGIHEQVKRAMTLNDSVDSNLANVKLELDVVKTSMLKTLNAGMQQSDKKAVATEIEGIKENFFAWANTSINNEYLFAGSNSTQQPFVKDANGKISYVGDNVLKQVPVEPNSYRDRGVTGYDAFNTWDFPESITTGEKLDFFATDTIKDNNGTTWTLNALTSKLEDSSGTGASLEVIKLNGGYQFKDPLPDDFKNGNGDAVTSFTSNTTVHTTVADPNTMTFSDYHIIEDNEGNAWEINREKMELRNGEGDVIALTAVGDNYEFPVTSFTNSHGDTINEFTLRDAQVRQYDKYGNLTGENLLVSKIDNGDGLIDNEGDTGLLEPKYKTQTVTDSSLIFESKHNIFNDLDDIITTLNGYSLTDGVTPISEEEQNDFIRASLDKITAAFDAVNIAHSKVGSRNKIIEDASINISAKITNFNVMALENNQADLAKVAMEAKSLEMTYTALYSTVSRMHQLNLVNFLK